MITTKIDCKTCAGIGRVTLCKSGTYCACAVEDAGAVCERGFSATCPDCSGVVYTQRSNLSKWDRRFIELAEGVAAWSKGPRKRIGSAIVRPDRSIASLGYNGPPRGFDDAAFLAMSRDEQHAVVIHAEINAIEQRHEAEDLAGHTLYVSPLFPCHKCAARIVEAGISRVVAYCGHISPDWRESAQQAEAVLIAAGVSCLFITD